MKNSVKTKPIKTARSRKILPLAVKPLGINPSSSSNGYNPTVCLQLDGKDYIKIDLWTMVLVYAPKEACEVYSRLRLYLDDKEIIRGDKDKCQITKRACPKRN